MKDDDPLVDLVVEEAGWQAALPDLPELANRAAELALAGAGLDPERYAIALLACNDDRIAVLNAEFRGREAPTNVLSWPAWPVSPQAPGQLPGAPEAPAGARLPLGDVAISLQTVEREASLAAIPLKSHAIHLILHGCLHLVGFDHETDGDAARMEGLESRLLTGLGIPDPYL